MANVQNYGRSPRMLSDQALGMFQTPEAMAETGLRQIMRTEAMAMQPDEQMIGFQEGGVRPGDVENGKRLDRRIVPGPEVEKYPLKRPDRFRYFRPGGIAAFPGVNPAMDPTQTVEPYGRIFNSIAAMRPLTEEQQRVAPQQLPSPLPPGGSAGLSMAMTDFGNAPQYIGKTAPQFVGTQAPKLDDVRSTDLAAAEAAYLSQRQPDIDAALKPMQDQADMANADAAEVARNSKWDALINAGIRMMAGGDPNDPRSANFLSQAAGGMADYVNTVKADKERVRQMKREAAMITVELAKSRFTMGESMRSAGRERAGQQLGLDNQAIGINNEARMGLAGFEQANNGQQNQYNLSTTEMENRVGLGNAQIVAQWGMSEMDLAGRMAAAKASADGKGGVDMREIEQTADEAVQRLQATAESGGQPMSQADVAAAKRQAMVQALAARYVQAGATPAQALEAAKTTYAELALSPKHGGGFSYGFNDGAIPTMQGDFFARDD